MRGWHPAEVGAWRGRRACPTEPERRALRSRWIDAAILAFGLTYLLGRVVVPRLIDALT